MIPAVVLAAGESRRMGRPKALLPLGPTGETFISRIVGTLRAAGADDVLVIVGAEVQAIAAATGRMDPPPRVIENAAWRDGQLSSLLAGLAVADRPGVRGLLVTLVDIPLVRASTVRAVLGAHRRTGAPVVRPEMGGRHGHPVLFDRSTFDELRRADPRVGAKAVVRAHERDILNVTVEDEGAFIDIDTPEAYERHAPRAP